TEVFAAPAELQGAYDFVQGSVAPEALSAAIATATLRSIADEKRVYVAIDGTSLTLTDRGGHKGFGSIGARGFPTRGLKVIDALVVTESGVPAGLAHIEHWARGPRSSQSRHVSRRLGLTEMSHWVDTIETVAARFEEHAPDTSVCFVIDREG